MKNMKKILVLAMAALLLVAVSVAGTVAYLTATSDNVTNTFTAAELSVTLTETEQNWSKPLLPGETYAKDPVVKLGENSADAWVFVEIIETNNTLTAGGGNKVTYTVSSDWVQVKNGDTVVKTDTEGSVGIWMYKMKALTASASVYLLSGGTDNNGSVTVNTAVTKADMVENNLPSITFKAYALQSDNLKVNDTEITTSEQAAQNAYAMWQLVAPADTSTGN